MVEAVLEKNISSYFNKGFWIFRPLNDEADANKILEQQSRARIQARLDEIPKLQNPKTPPGKT